MDNERDAVIRKHDLVPYIDQVYDLIPLHRWNYTDSRGRERGKSPIHNRWTNMPPCTLDALMGHLENGGNVGVRLDATQLIVDYDPRNDPDGEGWDAFVMEVGQEWIDSCPRVITGSGGHHLYAALVHE